MSFKNYEYKKRLYNLLQRIPQQDKMERLVFRECCIAYQDFLDEKRLTSRVSKEYLVEKAVEKGILDMAWDKKEKKIKLPSDREVRRAISRLIYSGYPVDTYSGEAGVAICDNPKTMQDRKAENEKRAKMLLAKCKGYDRATMFIQGQIDMIDLLEVEE